MEKSEIKFLKSKDYKVVSGFNKKGATSKTILIEDETINEKFVCKKYSPFHPEYKEEYYNYFKNEIKLLHTLYHRNIVRVFNYYLYPKKLTGYILMEYIDGNDIDVYIKENPPQINDVFKQVIDGFVHLEKAGILHRDIRPSNIIISKNGIVKIIDFGFSKSVSPNYNNNSLSLNWYYTIPEDIKQKTYDIKTEIYFIGKLFKDVISKNELENFKYNSILDKMIPPNSTNRVSSFIKIYSEIPGIGSIQDDFSAKEKSIYQEFANNLIHSIAHLYTNTSYIRDLEIIKKKLLNVVEDSMLEDTLQHVPSLIRCFIDSEYYYENKRDIPIQIIKDFYNLLSTLNNDKQKIVLNNLWLRFNSIRKEIPMDDLPF